MRNKILKPEEAQAVYAAMVAMRAVSTVIIHVRIPHPTIEYMYIHVQELIEGEVRVFYGNISAVDALQLENYPNGQDQFAQAYGIEQVARVDTCKIS